MPLTNQNLTYENRRWLSSFYKSFSEWCCLLHVFSSIFSAICTRTINLKLKKSIHYCEFNKELRNYIQKKKHSLIFVLFKSAEASDHINILWNTEKYDFLKEARCTDNLSSVLAHHRIKCLFCWLITATFTCSQKEAIHSAQHLATCLVLELNSCFRLAGEEDSGRFFNSSYYT